MQTAKPKPGSEVHLVLVTHSANPDAKPTSVLDGTVIDNLDWERDPAVFCLIKPGDDIPIRVVHMKNVVSINGRMVEGWNIPTQPAQTWTVESSSGPWTYKVMFDGIHWQCGCKGFSFQRHCRHIDEVKAKNVQSPAATHG